MKRTRVYEMHDVELTTAEIFDKFNFKGDLIDVLFEHGNIVFKIGYAKDVPLKPTSENYD